MLKQLIVQKRNKLKHAGERNKKDSEKDLLTLMIESELNGEGGLTDEELLVSQINVSREKPLGYVIILNIRATLASSFWRAMTPRQMP